MIVFYLGLIIFFSFLLVKATDILIISLKSLAVRTKLGQFAVTGLILALATSLPELLVGVTSALKGRPNLSLGNIVGSNIANLSLIIGGAALTSGIVQVRGDFLKRNVFYTFLAGAAPMILLFDKSLSRLDGIILLCLYGFYQAMVIGERRKAAPVEEEDGLVRRLIRRLNHRGTRRDLGWLFLGVTILLFSADMLVWAASKAALILGIPIFLIGLVLVAVGTSLPELVFEAKAIRARQPEMVFGDLLGSVVANATLIIGLTSLISPIRIQAFSEYLLATIAFVVIFGVFYLFIRTKHRLDRWEGALLIGFYLVFIFLEFI
jgi:cation:H+ antiporter